MRLFESILSIEEQAHCLGLRGDVAGLPLLVVPDEEVGALGEQHLDQHHVVLEGRVVQRRLPAVVRPVREVLQAIRIVTTVLVAALEQVLLVEGQLLLSALLTPAAKPIFGLPAFVEVNAQLLPVRRQQRVLFGILLHLKLQTGPAFAKSARNWLVDLSVLLCAQDLPVLYHIGCGRFLDLWLGVIVLVVVML